MNTEATAPALTDQDRVDRINNLTDDQKRMMLIYLDGYAPKVIDAGFDRLAVLLEPEPAPIV